MALARKFEACVAAHIKNMVSHMVLERQFEACMALHIHAMVFQLVRVLSQRAAFPLPSCKSA